jgi:protein-disulfide isomerase
MNNRFVVVIIALVLAFLGVVFVSKDKKADAPSTNDQSIKATEHKQGAGNKGVTLIEYGDFECPACGAYYPLVKQVKEKYKDDITFQFRNFPLVQIHRNAMVAHRAAEAADKQGKFFEMHDMLYERQQSWKSETNPTTVFEGYAQELGLNVEQFRRDAASGEINDIINADIKEGQAADASATPTFVINGKKVEQNPRDLEAFYKLIDDAIKEAEAQR